MYDFPHDVCVCFPWNPENYVPAAVRAFFYRRVLTLSRLGLLTLVNSRWAGRLTKQRLITNLPVKYIGVVIGCLVRGCNLARIGSIQMIDCFS